MISPVLQNLQLWHVLTYFWLIPCCNVFRIPDSWVIICNMPANSSGLSLQNVHTYIMLVQAHSRCKTPSVELCLIWSNPSMRRRKYTHMYVESAQIWMFVYKRMRPFDDVLKKVEMLPIWDTVAPMWRRCNEISVNHIMHQMELWTIPTLGIFRVLRIFMQYSWFYLLLSAQPPLWRDKPSLDPISQRQLWCL